MAIIEGFVALIDILGFQEFVRRPDFDARVQQYLTTLDGIVGRSAQEISYQQASDSTILATADLGEEALRSLLETVSAISLAALVEMDLPMRGGIASGRYAVQDAGRGGSGIAGPAVVDAYRTEQKQDWVGAMLSPSLFLSIPNLQDLLTPTPTDGVDGHGRPRWPKLHADNVALESRMRWLLLAARYTRIPLHSTSPMSDPKLVGFAVTPKRLDTHTPEGAITDLEDFEQALERLTIFAPDDAAQRKYSEGRFFCSAQADIWRRLVSRNTWLERENPD